MVLPTLPSSFATSLTEWPPLNLYQRKSGRRDFPVSDLVYIQALANYCWLNWADGKRMLMPRTLNYYKPQLPDQWFIRLHHNCLVNRNYITRLERTSTGGIVYLTTGETLPVARRRWSDVLHQLTQANPSIN